MLRSAVTVLTLVLLALVGLQAGPVQARGSAQGVAVGGAGQTTPDYGALLARYPRAVQAPAAGLLLLQVPTADRLVLQRGAHHRTRAQATGRLLRAALGLQRPHRKQDLRRPWSPELLRLHAGKVPGLRGLVLPHADAVGLPARVRKRELALWARRVDGRRCARSAPASNAGPGERSSASSFSPSSSRSSSFSAQGRAAPDANPLARDPALEDSRRGA
jgi:hypothetical protein